MILYASEAGKRQGICRWIERAIEVDLVLVEFPLCFIPLSAITINEFPVYGKAIPSLCKFNFH